MAQYELDVEYQLRETRSEINRHHLLITELRDALLHMLQWVDPLTLSEKDRKSYDHYHDLLYRQVS